MNQEKAVTIACKPNQVLFEGRCLTPDRVRLECKPGQVLFEGRCLTPDRHTDEGWVSVADTAAGSIFLLLALFAYFFTRK